MPSDSQESQIFSGWGRPEGCVKHIEQVGKAYEKLKVKYNTLRERMEKGVSAQFESDEDEEKKDEQCSDCKKTPCSCDAEEPQQRNDEYEKKRKHKTKAEIEREALELGDLYGLLGLGEKTHEATENEINRAYKRMALKYHPDKKGDNFTDEDKAHWLKLQSAYETLSDPLKKKKYDSSLPFDDSLPDEKNVDDKNFFQELGRTFLRNAMWSKKKPVPDIGDENTPIELVKKFYKFWDNFESWREFSQFDEYDVTEAADRYERRYMENENRNGRKKYMKAERARFIKLVELAYKKDPRIRKEQELIEAEK